MFNFIARRELHQTPIKFLPFENVLSNLNSGDPGRFGMEMIHLKTWYIRKMETDKTNTWLLWTVGPFSPISAYGQTSNVKVADF